jgi:tRNA threonylcarbamoyladenosine biosynthesis protein TsaE
MKNQLNTTLDQIPVLAQEIAKNLKGGEIFALIGQLGSGKTTFVKTLVKALKLNKNVPSPTFVIMNMFGAKVKNKPLIFYHLDLYRTKNFREVKSLGIQEFWGKAHTITFIEWADKIKSHLPKKTITIKFKS